jgi:hypothetical protein
LTVHQTKHRILLLVLPSLLLSVVALLPFLKKAYTIDDPWFLLEARQILKTPLQPMSFPICWMGDETCLPHAGALGAGTTQGLMGYLLVPVVLLSGSEWLAHLFQILLVFLAILEMVKLSLRLGFDPAQSAVAGLFLVSIPPFLSMASTAMPDIAAVALGLTGLERLLAWKVDHLWHQGALAALALGLAPYARPQIALFMPLGALWLFDELHVQKALTQLRRQTYLWIPVVVAGCILVSVNFLTRDRHIDSAKTDLLIGRGHILINALAYFRYLFFPLPFALVWLGVRWRRAKILIVFPAIPILFAHFMIFPSRSLLQEWPMAAVVYGFTALVDMVFHYIRQKDRLGMTLSLWILIPCPAIFYAHLPLKYLVAVLPAVALIMVRELSSLRQPRAIVAHSTIILACVGYSLILLRADADFADYGRRAAAALIAPHVAAGEKVWFGGEWGFYWYAQEAGARISKPGEPGPNPGELLAVGLMEGGNVTLHRFPNRELIDSRTYDSPHGRTMGYGAGLYSNSFGDVPWVWNPQTTNVYQLWRIH